MKILMVCLGNICRSPLAEGILKSKVSKYDLPWEVDSAGTGPWHVGESPDPRSVQVAQKNALDITDQRGRQFQPSDFDNFDIIYVMDQSNFRNVVALAKSDKQRQKVRLILEAVNPGSGAQVPDPYYDNGFDKVYSMLDEACEQITGAYHLG